MFEADTCSHEDEEENIRSGHESSSSTINNIWHIQYTVQYCAKEHKTRTDCVFKNCVNAI